MTEHTPTPWKAGKWDITHINGHKHHFISIVNNVPDGECEGTGVAVCLMPQENDTPKDRKTVKANAAFIVRACNCHEELVEALKGLMSWKMRDGSPCYCPAGKDEDEPHGKMPTIHSTACLMARSALAKAGRS